MAGDVTYRWIHRVWYDDGSGGWWLRPLAAVYWLVLSLHAALYRYGVFSSAKAAVPVIIVGNITAGGTGKTPVVIWLVEQLRAKGFQPGVISRGYGGSHSGASMRVDQNSDPMLVGDEPVLLAKRCQCPVVIDADRVRGTEMLVEDGVTVIVADDGLQHRRLQRDVEICVIDGKRGLGNRRLLPAGPLREPARRLESVDQILVNGVLSGGSDVTNAELNALAFELIADEAVRLDGSLARPLQHFKGMTVHAVAGIGNPQRFFALLRAQGLHVLEHAFRDHAALTRQDLEFGDDLPVLMTEKDAVKLSAKLAQKYWYIPVTLQMDSANSAPFLDQIESRIRTKERG